MNKEIAVGHIAVRDEGTPEHYPSRAREVSASSAGVAAIEQVLKWRGLPYHIDKT